MAPSIVTKSLVLAAAVSSAALFESADAHQYVMLPAPTFTVKTRAEQFNPLAFLENQGFKTTADFNAYYKAKGYKSLRAFMDDKKAYKVAAGADFQCGWTKLDGKRQPIPAGTIRSTGYTHDGPCEVWLDNTLVMKGNNCHSEFPGTTHKISYASCKGSCTLRWYWMGIRFLKGKYSWQVYKNCVPIGGKRLLEEQFAEGNSTELYQPHDHIVN
jgi:hypothetical protein|uniref:Uncharacterized protein n=1 Tax=Globisporangium ultimum (strain ATCC 200006 / CBS 805.95 / DAOM BR144) TaxID=431595 RepID=K3W9V4_GLOUD